MTKTTVAVASDVELIPDTLACLMAKANLPLVNADSKDSDLLLVQTVQRLELRQTGKNTTGPVYADFVTGKAAYRRAQGIGKKQPIAKAVGVKPNTFPSMIDATAGLGQDALLLATLGCQVRLIERSPIIAALLSDALQRALADVATAEIAQRMRLIQADAGDFLGNLDTLEQPDVIYLDPMFPKRNKSALVKKEMQLFQLLLDSNDSGDDLLAIALNHAKQRVVVKRPSKAPYLAGIKPNLQFNAGKIRFDVYLINDYFSKKNTQCRVDKR